MIIPAGSKPDALSPHSGSQAMLTSFRIRLTIAFWAVILLWGYCVAHHFNGHFSHILSEETKASTIRQLHQIDWLMHQSTGPDNVEKLQSWFAQLGENLGLRITYIASGGQVIADSELPPSGLADLDNHATRPEFIEARSRDLGIAVRYSGTLQADMLYVAKSVDGVKGIPPGVLRTSVPLTRIPLQPNLLSGTTVSWILLFFLGTALLGFGLTAGLNRSLHSLADAAKAVGQGDPKPRRMEVDGALKQIADSLTAFQETTDARLSSMEGSQAALEAVFTGMRDGVMILDSRGKVARINRAFEEMSAGLPPTLDHRPLEVLLSPELQAACTEMLKSGGEAPGPTGRIQVRVGGNLYGVRLFHVEHSGKAIGVAAIFERAGAPKDPETAVCRNDPV